MWIVKVVEDDTGEVIKEIPCKSEHSSERVLNGVEINLDWSRFSAMREEVKDI